MIGRWSETPLELKRAERNVARAQALEGKRVAITMIVDPRSPTGTGPLACSNIQISPDGTQARGTITIGDRPTVTYDAIDVLSIETFEEP